MIRTSVTVLLLGCSAVVAGCGGPGPVDVVASPGTAATSPGPSADGCPTDPGNGNSAVMVDYVDFVQANGQQYVADLGGHHVELAAADIGRVQFYVRCSLSEPNAQTHQSPPPLQDGYAGHLPTGTPVHAITGWSPRCRLAAQRDGSWKVYLAQDVQAPVATPTRCALTAG